jgi:3-deoxy-D-manno-octulosonic-acid transferase
MDATQAVADAVRVLAEPERRQAMSKAAREFAAQHRGATARTLDAVAPLIESRAGFRSVASQAVPEA